MAARADAAGAADVAQAAGVPDALRVPAAPDLQRARGMIAAQLVGDAAGAAGALPPRAQGQVAQVFRSSANLALAGRLVHVGSWAQPLSCLGLAVAPELVARLVAAARPGDVAVLRPPRELVVYGRADAVVIALDALEPVPCALPELAGAVADRAAALRWLAAALDRTVGDAVRAFSPLAGDERAQQALAACAVGAAAAAGTGEPSLAAAAAATGDSVDAARVHAIRFLIGRGPGLTPSGDDALIGCGIALHLADGSSGRAAAFDRALSYVRAVRPDATTVVSAAYLAAYGAGFANPIVRELVDAARARDAAAVDRVLTRIMRIGHTSGADTLLGLRAGIAAVLGACGRGPMR